MSDDEGGELSAGVRQAPLEERRPQGKLQRHAGIGYELVQALDAPVLQMVEQLPDVHHFFATCLPVVDEQVIDVPRIILENIPTRRLCRDTQLVEQLVEVPTIVPYSSLLRTMEQHVDISVPSGGGRRGRERRTRLWPKLERWPGQGSTAFCGAEPHTHRGIPPGQDSTAFCGATHETLPDSRPGQGSTAFCGAERHTHRGFHPGQGSPAFCGAEQETLADSRPGHGSPALGGAQYGFLPGQDSTASGGAHHGFLPGSSSTAFHGAELHGLLPGSSSTAFDGVEHLHHLPALSSDERSSGGPCVSACSSVQARATRGTSARLHMHGKSSILTLLSGACRRGIHRQPRAVHKYWAVLRCGSFGRLCDHALQVPAVLADTVEGTSDSVHRQSVGKRSSWVGRPHARWCANDRALVRQWRKLFRSCFPLTRWSTSLACGSCRFSGVLV